MGKGICIEYPKEGTGNTWAAKVSGKVWGCKDEVQLMVLAADNKWYPQPRVKKCGKRFEGLAYLGWETNPNAKSYTVAAGVGGAHITEVLDELPDDVLWTSVTVERI